MRDNLPPRGNLALPEFQDLQQIFNTLRDRVTAMGHPQMGTFLVDAELGGVMVVGHMQEIIMLSRLLATIGSSPLVNMPGH